MINADLFSITPEVAAALAEGRPVVALETSIVGQGMPWPDNIETAHALSAAVIEVGAVPAFIGLAGHRIHVGLDEATLERFARGGNIAKVSRRDIAAVLAAGNDGATTVAATMIAAERVGIRVFATGGIGGVHRGFAETHDVSADLYELARTPVAVVCSGAKSILDLQRTLEVLETLGVPVIGYGTDRLPAFFSRDAGPDGHLGVDVRVDRPEQAAALLIRHWRLGLGGAVVAQPIAEEWAIPTRDVETWIAAAVTEAAIRKITGKDLTPFFLLGQVAKASGGRTLAANKALVVANARLAATLAASLAATGRSG